MDLQTARGLLARAPYAGIGLGVVRLEESACALHADGGVARGVRRPEKVLLGFELPPTSSVSSSASVGPPAPTADSNDAHLART